jgi:hypothetical protein
MAVTLDDLREHVGAGPSDADLERALEAALEAVDERYGPVSDTYTEYDLNPYGHWVDLGRRAARVGSVVEGTDILDTTDYVLAAAGDRIARLDSSSRSTAWSARVTVTYTPLIGHAWRDAMVIALCDADLTNSTHAGLTGVTVGPWSETYGDAADTVAQREAILASGPKSGPSVW